jgi:hypothetical protein
MIAAFLQLLWLLAFVGIGYRGGGYTGDRNRFCQGLVQGGLKLHLVRESPRTSPWSWTLAQLRLRAVLAPA